jgi:hypothetical protein
MTEAEKKAFVEAQGWYTWYNENYWVHPEIHKAYSAPFNKPERLDHTSHGKSLDTAYLIALAWDEAAKKEKVDKAVKGWVK